MLLFFSKLLGKQGRLTPSTLSMSRVPLFRSNILFIKPALPDLLLNNYNPYRIFPYKFYIESSVCHSFFCHFSIPYLIAIRKIIFESFFALNFLTTFSLPYFPYISIHDQNGNNENLISHKDGFLI